MARAAIDTAEYLSLIDSASLLGAIAIPGPRPASLVAADQPPYPPIDVGRCYRSKPTANGAFLMQTKSNPVIFSSHVGSLMLLTDANMTGLLLLAHKASNAPSIVRGVGAS